jgi:hypothetical protein
MKKPKEDFIDFSRVDSSSKTHRFDIVSKTGRISLGTVRFHPAWRRFVFCPNGDTLYDSMCMYRIASFCDEQTTLWKESRFLNDI